MPNPPAHRPPARARFYDPADREQLGALCVDGCGQRVPLALIDAGMTGHPTCGREHAYLIRRHAASVAKAAARAADA